MKNTFTSNVIIVQSDLKKVTDLSNPIDPFNEFKDLVRSTGANILKEYHGQQNSLSAKYFLGKGKVDEICQATKEYKVDLVIFNHELSPSQERNLERELRTRVLDRTGLILDIFASRATSHIGKMQVELAQLSHLSTRLVRGWSHLERQKGGIGLRGPGETQLETDRRLIANRIKSIKKRLEKSHRQKKLNRYARKKGNNHVIALVGYTNAGKTTLFNKLTGSEQYEADQLFATLDTVTRKNLSPGSGSILYIDTVGFISSLPTALIESFKATLEDLREADLLLHVSDVSDIDCDFKCKEVNKILREINADNIPQIIINNKIDRADEANAIGISEDVNQVSISASKGIGISRLKEKITNHLSKGIFKGRLSVTQNLGAVRASLYQQGYIEKEEVVEGSWIFDVLIGNYELNEFLAKEGVELVLDDFQKEQSNNLVG
tara:strand:+ start:61 stop:1368 length:1308 start_codon:yes stop_codon:yes gene_type:complete